MGRVPKFWLGKNEDEYLKVTQECKGVDGGYGY